MKKTEIKDAFQLYRLIRKKYKNTALLESLGEYDKDTSRYSMIGVIADKVLYEEEERYIVKNLYNDTQRYVDSWMDIIDEWTNEREEKRNIFKIGTIGYIGYENLRFFQRVPVRKKLKCGCANLYLVHYALLYVYDRGLGYGWWIYEDNLFEPFIRQIETEFYRMSQEKNQENVFFTLGDGQADFTHEEYIQSIKQCQEYIRRGDIFQANITMRYHGRYHGDPFLVYEELREITPNPYFAYFDFENPLISTSPESFLRVYDQTVESRPIKGTVRCVIDGVDQGDFLMGSKKNIAENVMITDLIRNDIGRICKIGTVDVPKLCHLKEFNNLYHLETLVTGQIKESIKLSDILKANFPGGSITGAPKVRALEIIDELESADRGPYCGTIGFFGENGYINTSIGIRLIYFDKENYYVHAGGGIVAKSDQEDEYEELVLKIERLLQTLQQHNILLKYRNDLDRLDIEILKLFEKRFLIIEEVSDIKSQYNIPSLQPKRIDDMLEKRKRMIENGELLLRKKFVADLLELIVKEAMEIEERNE